MQLDRLSLVLRQRNPWEAIDLGFAMARAWWRPIYAAWLAAFVPITLVAFLLLPPDWAALLIWWLKPAFDRIVLHVAAGAVFGTQPRLRDTLRSYFSYARNGLLSSLLPLPRLRFSLTRSLTLPIHQLENASGQAARARARQLRGRVSSHAQWLTFACLQFEAVLLISFVGLYDFLVPAASRESFEPFELFLDIPQASWGYIFGGLYVACVALIEPVYVTAGFALYLARRTQLEGWDLEVQLRRIAQAQEEKQKARPLAAASSVAVLLVLVGLVTLLTPAFGADDTTRRPGTPAEEIKAVLERSEFQEFETQTVITSLHPSKSQPEDRKSATRFSDFIALLAQVLRAVGWALLGAGLLFALYWIARRLKWIGGAGSQEQWTPPSTLFGMDVRPESLPDDVAAQAAQRARAGDVIGALSLLYRGALVTLLHRDRVPLESGDTEADCLAKTRERLAVPAFAYLGRLLFAWQGAAYAHRIPPVADVEQLAAEWGGFFGAAA